MSPQCEKANMSALITTKQGNRVVNRATNRIYGFVGRDEALDAEKIYTGRDFPRLGLLGSPLGNYEYRVKNHSPAEHNRAVAAFRPWFEREMSKGRQGKASEVYQEVDRIADKLLQGQKVILTCFCAQGLPCHTRDVVQGAIIDRALEKQREQQFESERTGATKSSSKNSAALVDAVSEPTQPTIEEGIAALTRSSIGKCLALPINIYTRSPDWLGASLTNPTTIAEYWAAKGQSGIRDRFPVFFKGQFWKDAEEAYQHFKEDVPAGPERSKLMTDILKAKLEQYPELVKAIDKRGGRRWLETCEHKVNGGFWEGKGLKSPFIKCLAAAYERVSDRLNEKAASRTMTVAFSGSRSKYFTNPIWKRRAKRSLDEMVKTTFETAERLGYDRVCYISGCALGVDFWGAISALKARKQQRQGQLPSKPKIEVLAAIPCIGQEGTWKQADQRRYFKLLNLVDDLHLVSRDHYKNPGQLFERNSWMVERLSGRDDILAVVQVGESSGTQDTIEKARSQGKAVLRYSPETNKYSYEDGGDVQVKKLERFNSVPERKRSINQRSQIEL
ncbi:SLOG family protein [Iningainema tapete]|uniref:DUF1273 family protein n=1 Tax=Iningainema tapete BLCC-T55 TaxID=2748662 RepID=A0A8J6XLD2_9CYAN|nr:SLOG family protein [Iningainema tapete]MBD2772567.1 DUF1273 family protein [Iningainema tapete BLCC-T55]